MESIFMIIINLITIIYIYLIFTYSLNFRNGFPAAALTYAEVGVYYLNKDEPVERVSTGFFNKY